MMFVLLWDGVLVSNSDCGGPSLEGSRSLSKMLERASQRALVTGEWYIPGHKLSGFLIDELASMCGGDSSNGDANVETTWIGEGESGVMGPGNDR